MPLVTPACDNGGDFNGHGVGGIREDTGGLRSRRRLRRCRGERLLMGDPRSRGAGGIWRHIYEAEFPTNGWETMEFYGAQVRGRWHLGPPLGS